MPYLLILISTLLISQGCTSRSSLARESGQNSHPQTETSENQKLSSFSPYEIKKFVNANKQADLNPIWNFYGIKAEPFERYNQRYVSYEAEIYPVALDTDSFDDLLLRVWYGETYRYLVFKGLTDTGGESGSWKYLGYVDVDAQKYAPPEHRVVIGENQTWLVLKELWGRGTGVVRYGEQWYEINGEELKAVLGYPVTGHQFSRCGNLGRDFDSKVTDHGSIKGIYTVNLQFSVSYSLDTCGNPPQSIPLFSKLQKASYVWTPKASDFVLDKSNSELSEEEIEAVYNFDSLGGEDFVEYNFKELLNLADTGSIEQKGWLRRFLSELPSSSKKKVLNKALMK